MWFGAIAHQPETRTNCRLSECGHATYCGHCFVEAIADHRAALRQTGNPINREPSAAWRA
ncbi:MAG: hypothetical protein JO120_09095 [Solirubrobacterales bacterium]|nr:hypothetical protein [Solirubrobacterales bacterium]